MKNHKVKIAKREFPLVFTLGAMERMEKAIPGFNLTEIDKILQSTSGLLDVLFALAQNGAVAEGRQLDVDRDWFGAHTPVSQTRIVSIYKEIVDTLVDGMSMESDVEDEDREVDVVLQELKKKEEKTV